MTDNGNEDENEKKEAGGAVRGCCRRGEYIKDGRKDGRVEEGVRECVCETEERRSGRDKERRKEKGLKQAINPLKEKDKRDGRECWIGWMANINEDRERDTDKRRGNVVSVG